MTRFLAVYSTTPFQGDCTISEVCSKFSEKNQKIFSVTPYFKLPKSLRNTGGMHFLTPFTDPSKMRDATLFFIFLLGISINHTKR